MVISIKTNFGYDKAYERKFGSTKTQILSSFKKKNDWNSVILSAENIDQALLNFSNTFLIHIRECMP